MRLIEYPVCGDADKAADDGAHSDGDEWKSVLLVAKMILVAKNKRESDEERIDGCKVACCVNAEEYDDGFSAEHV